MHCIRIISSIVAMSSLTASAIAGPVTFTDASAYPEGAVEPQVVVELVPNNPGPYFGGEHVTIDVWLNVEVGFLVGLGRVQFDFSDTDPALSLDSTFLFDYSASSGGSHGWLITSTDLPVPYTWMALACVCPYYLLIPSEEGLLHAGSIGVALPFQGGTYRMDTLNADEPFEFSTVGAELEAIDLSVPLPLDPWRAYTGEITGGSFDLVVIPEPATLGLLALGGLTVMCGRRRAIRGHSWGRVDSPTAAGMICQIG